MLNDEIEFKYIGWCKGTHDGVKNDKVWTAFKAGGAYYAGWGGRGKKMRFKRHPNLHELNKVKRRKEKEYEEVDKFLLFSIFPTFEEDVSKTLVFEILTDRVM